VATLNFDSKYSAGSIPGLVFIGLGLYIGISALYDAFRVDLGDYKQIVGVVLESYVQSTAGSGGGRGSGADYRPVVKYSYIVDHITYEGTNKNSQSVITLSAQRKPSADVVSKYHPGAKIAVWYNIDNPDISVVSIVDKKNFSKFMGVLTCFAFGILCILSDRWVVRRRARRDG